MDTRATLVEHMSTKHEYIMKKFISEIGVIEHEFLKYRKSPPLTRNQHEHIGAILWQRLLFDHLKSTVLAFKELEDEPELKNSYLKRTAFSQYFTLAHEMTDFEKKHFQNYLDEGVGVVNGVMNRHLLKLSVCSKHRGKYIFFFFTDF